MASNRPIASLTVLFVLGMVAPFGVIGRMASSPSAQSFADLDGDGAVDGANSSKVSDPRSSTSTASGSPIAGVAFNSTNSPVFTVNPFSGAGQQIGLSGFPRLNSMAQDASGVLYSAVDNPAAAQQQLIAIDRQTGSGTAVATLNFGSVTPDVRGLAFSPTQVLYAINNTGPAGGLNPDDLFTIDANTGVGSLVGRTGLTSVQGLAFSPSGVLYAWDIDVGLVTVNTATGAASDVSGAAGGTVEIQTIAFDSDGTLFGANDALFDIDPLTGVFSEIGAGGYSDLRGIEIPLPTPTLTSIAPASGVVGKKVYVRLTGSNLEPGSTTVNVSGPGILVTTGPDSVSTTTNRAVNFLIAPGTAPGPRDVTVTTPNGTSNALTFTVTSPGAASCFASLPLSASGGRGVLNITAGFGAGRQASGRWVVGAMVFQPRSVYFRGITLSSGPIPAANPPLLRLLSFGMSPAPAVAVVNAFYNPHLCGYTAAWTSTLSSTASAATVPGEEIEAALRNLDAGDFNGMPLELPR